MSQECLHSEDIEGVCMIIQHIIVGLGAKKLCESSFDVILWLGLAIILSTFKIIEFVRQNNFVERCNIFQGILTSSLFAPSLPPETQILSCKTQNPSCKKKNHTLGYMKNTKVPS